MFISVRVNGPLFAALNGVLQQCLSRQTYAQKQAQTPTSKQKQQKKKTKKEEQGVPLINEPKKKNCICSEKCFSAKERETLAAPDNKERCFGSCSVAHNCRIWAKVKPEGSVQP